METATAGLTRFARTIKSKRSGEYCQFCAGWQVDKAGKSFRRQNVVDVDFATVDAKGQWRAVCTTCALSVVEQCKGLVRSIQQLIIANPIAFDLGLDDIDVQAVCLGQRDDRETYEALVRLLKARAAYRTASDPVLSKLGVIADDPKSKPRDREFAASLLDYASRKPLTDPQVAGAMKMINRLATSNVPSLTDALVDIPDGRYAVPAFGGSTNDLIFVLVGTNKGVYNNNRKGLRYMYQVVGGNKQHAPRGSWCVDVAAAILKAGVEASAILYGQHLGHCGFCGKSLTKKYSREIGYGPDCADKYGLPFDHAAYSVSQRIV